jgi:hypothetical protein
VRANVVGDEGFAVLGAKNQVDVEAGERLRHGLGRPFRAGVGVMTGHPGRCPGLA